MKKFFLAITIFMFFSFLSSCNFDCYSGKRPYDYGLAKWVCEDPDAWFVVDPDADDYYSPKGEMEINGEIQRIQLIFVNGTNRVFVELLDKNSSWITEYKSIIDGKCTFSPEKMIIEVYKDMDAILNDQYDELIFIRTATE